MKNNIVVALAATLALGSGIYMYSSAHDSQLPSSSARKGVKASRTQVAVAPEQVAAAPTSVAPDAGAEAAPARKDTKAISSITITPKALSDQVAKGLAYLVAQQDASGGWAQGDEAKTMGGATKVTEVPNVADTCLATLALIRAGNHANTGKYAGNVAKAVAFVCGSVEKADADSIFVTDIKNTRVQMKLGPYVDTFYASLLLAEAKDHMPDDASHARVRIALQKVVHKMQHNQQKDGQWAGGGWAPIHSQALAIQGLNRARQVGAVVSDDSLASAENFAKGNFDTRTKSFGAGGSAGIGLYSAGATLGAMQSSIATNDTLKGGYQKQWESTTVTTEVKGKARRELDRMKVVEDEQKQALDAVSQQIKDDKFIAGFGCNGGEEFLSYLHISETLIAAKKPEFPAWDQKITANLNKVQNQDGSWMGQHCITSRTFCTGAALLVLMADRSASQSIAAK